MTIRVSVIAATLSVSMWVPLAANAAGGTIRFVGAIVEQTRCQVGTTGLSARSMPQVNCVAPAGQPALVRDNVVKVSSRTFTPEPGANGAPERQRRVVTLEYL